MLQLYIWDSNSHLVARNLQLGAALEISAVPTCKINKAAFETSSQADCFGQKTRICRGSNKRIADVQNQSIPGLGLGLRVEARLGLGLGLGLVLGLGLGLGLCLEVRL